MSPQHASDSASLSSDPEAKPRPGSGPARWPAAQPAAAIRARGLVKRFAGVAVVDGVSFSVAPGEVVGLLGPNGAGKTTTLRLLAGLYAADAGEAKVSGETVRAGELPGASLRAKVGLLTETPGFYERLTARENLRYFAALYGGGRLLPGTGARMEEFLDRFGLMPHADRRYGTLSRGMKQKLAIIRAVLHAPPVLLLDEPTVGLDPESVGALRGLVSELAAAGCAVLLCTHLLDEVERLCQRAVFLARRVVGIHDVLRQERRIQIAFVSLPEGGGAMQGLARKAAALPGVRTATATATATVTPGTEAGGPGELSVELEHPDRVAEVVRFLTEAGAGIRSVRPARVALESAYLALLATAREEGLLE